MSRLAGSLLLLRLRLDTVTLVVLAHVVSAVFGAPKVGSIGGGEDKEDEAFHMKPSARMKLGGVGGNCVSLISPGKGTIKGGRSQLISVAEALSRGRQAASSEHGNYGRRKPDGGRQRWSDSDVDVMQISGLETQGRDPQLGPQEEAKTTQQVRPSAASGQELLMSQYIKSCTGWDELREVREGQSGRR